MSDLKTLSERQQHAKAELARIQKFPPHILRMSEAERDAAMVSLQQELGLLDGEIQAEAGRIQARHISQVYGTAPVAEGAQAELKQAEEALEKTLAGFEATARGYAVRVHAAYVRYFQCAGAAGQRVHLDSLLNAGAKRLTGVVEQGVRHGS